MTAAARGLVAVVSGPSGVGKTTVVARLLEKPGFSRSITATTRKARTGETNGVDYLFLTREAFQAGVKAGRFLEHATVHGHLYGTPRDAVEEVLARGDVCLLNVDVQGAAALRRSGLPVVTVFLLPPSMDELERRLGGRATEDSAEVERRLEIARREMAEADRFEMRVENRDLDETVGKIAGFLESRRRSG